MTCDEARKAIPGLALGEADVEVSRDVSAHLDACAPCRAEREAQERALSAMRGMVVETSERRRDAAIGAMTGARDELVERAIMRRPSVWPLRIVGVAAAVLVAVAVGWTLLRPDDSWRVAEASGPGLPRVGDRLRPGDTLSLLEGARATIENETGRLELSELASVTVRGRAAVQLMLGSVRVESRADVTVMNRWNDRVVVRGGSATVTSDLKAVGHADPPKVYGDRLRVRVERGQATLRGPRGEVLVEAGEESRLDENGKPAN